MPVLPRALEAVGCIVSPAQAVLRNNAQRPYSPPLCAMQARQIMQQMHNAVAAAEWGEGGDEPDLSIGNSVEDPLSMDEVRAGAAGRAW